MKLKKDDILIHTLKALKLIKESRSSDRINLDYLDKITPFCMVPIVSYIKKNKNKSKNKKMEILYPKEDCKLSYLNTIKFPNTTHSLKIKKMSYTPLFELKNELGFDEDNEKILDLLEKIIVENFDLKDNVQILMSVFNELICNIQQHSNSNFNCIQAQLYENKLAISLVDTGISIQGSYEKSGFNTKNNYSNYNNLDLFKLAFAGISTKDDKERGTGIPNSYNWICKGLKGSLVIISKDSAFKKLPNKNMEFIDLSSLNLNFKGTIINILFEKPKEKVDIYSFMNKPVV
jgi:hypothetical protein